jgi:hypothetical protein
MRGSRTKKIIRRAIITKQSENNKKNKEKT